MTMLSFSRVSSFEGGDPGRAGEEEEQKPVRTGMPRRAGRRSSVQESLPGAPSPAISQPSLRLHPPVTCPAGTSTFSALALGSGSSRRRPDTGREA